MNPKYADQWSVRVRTGLLEEPYRKDFLQSLRISKGDMVLEVGVGEGRNAAEVISAGATYVGLDISRRMLEKAREGIRNGSFKKVDLLVGDALLLPFRSSSFDKSMCFATVFFVPDQRGAIKQILRVSRSRAGIEFRNSHNPAIFLYKKAVAIVNTLQPMLRSLFRNKSFLKLLSALLGHSKADRLATQLLVYDSLQPVFPSTVREICDETQRNGWIVESLKGYPMLDSHKRTSNPKPKRFELMRFDPVLILQVARRTDIQNLTPTWKSDRLDSPRSPSQ